MTLGAHSAEQRLHLLQELRSQNFDTIRFASYRTASKLRFIQKKTFLHVIDIWNVIEAFRDNGLNTLEHHAEVNIARLEALISSLYHNLNKRLPSQQQISVETLSSMLLNWLLSAYGAETSGRIRVLSIKVALATMCAGKLTDKLRYIFSQIYDGNGIMVPWKFAEYLQEILALPAAVYESPSFTYSVQLATEIFPPTSKVTVNDFIDTIVAESGPSCFVWLPLLHRLANVETVVHPTSCDICQKENFSGFRYRCQKCHNFQMCQDCFWRGRLGPGHSTDHEVKEYSVYKSPSKQIGRSLRKSFRCVPDKGKSNIPRFPEEPEKPLNLSHIVPPSPLPSHNGFPDASSGSQYDYNSLDSRATLRSGGKYSSSFDNNNIDDEHKLIARYCARLAAEAATVGRTTSEGSLTLDSSRAQRELIFQLENKNREIMKEIAKLKKQQEAEEYVTVSDNNPVLMNELRALRLRKHELESHLITLQDSRRQLMMQLDGLTKLLMKNQQASPRSTPNSSPRSAKSPPPSRSAPPTPGSSAAMALASTDSMTIDVKSAFSGSPSGNNTNSSQSNMNNIATTPGGRSFRTDLLVAADSVTNAMSTLVRELNSEDSDEDEPTSASNIVLPLDYDNVGGSMGKGDI